MKRIVKYSRILLLLQFVFTVVFITSATAQVNLVADGGFENPNPCPSGISQLANASWTLPLMHTGTSDLFNVCGAPSVGVPTNFRNTNCPTYSGDGYAGGYAGLLNGVYREYFSDTLLAPLDAGARYTIEFYYRLADQATLACDGIGAHFSVQHPAAGASGTGWLELEPTTRNPVGEFLDNTSTWELYSESFVAQGGEQYMTIGVFDSIPSLQLIDSTLLPNYSYYMYDGVNIYYDPSTGAANHCFGESHDFAVDTIGLSSADWNFGDPASGALNTTTQFFPSHTYTDTGWFDVTVILDYDSIIDTITDQLYVYPRQTLNLGSDTVICDDESFLLRVAQPYSTYLWSDSSTADTFLVTQDTTVSVTVFGICDTLSDSIEVRFQDSISFDLGPDTLLCAGVSYLINANIQEEASLSWSTGLTGVDELTVQGSGVYHLTASNDCGVFSDTVEVLFKPIPTIDSLLPPDTVNCFDEVVILERPDNDSINYIWSDSTTKKTFEVDTTMTVWLAAENECGFSADTISIVFNGEIETDLGEDTAVCIDDSIQLFGTDSLATYVWNTGDTTDTIWTTAGVDQNYIVTITLGQCESISSKRISSQELLCPNINCDIEYGNYFTPNGDGLNDRFRVWSDCDVYSFDMAIYNRWGQLVNYTRNVAFGWDGFVNGEPASEGTYYFILEYKDFVVVDADRRVTQGSFTLTR